MNRRQRRRAERLQRRKEEQLSPKINNPKQISKIKGTYSEKSPPRKTFRPLQWLWKGLLAAIAIVGFAYQFRPEVNVDKDISLNPRDPFATQFRVTNEGRLAVHDLSFSCTVNNPNLQNVTTLNFVGQASVPTLESKDSTTKNCGIVADSYPFLSELFFDVSFSPKWYWGHLLKRTRFVNMRDSEGHLQWIKQAK